MAHSSHQFCSDWFIFCCFRPTVLRSKIGGIRGPSVPRTKPSQHLIRCVLCSRLQPALSDSTNFPGHPLHDDRLEKCVRHGFLCSRSPTLLAIMNVSI